MWGLLSSNCLYLFGYGNSITKHQVINRTLQDKLFINRISLSKSWSCRILSRIIIDKKIIVMLEKGFAYCSHFKSVEPGVFASQFAWIMCLRGFMFHGVNCSSDFLFWKIFFFGVYVGVTFFAWVENICSWVIHEPNFSACLGTIFGWVDYRWVNIFWVDQKLYGNL